MEQRLREIKARLQATTPGAWEAWKPPEDDFGTDICIYTDDGKYVAQTDYDGLYDRETMAADAEFIAHAKEDIAFLLEELEKLRPRPNPIDGFGDIWVNPARRTVQTEYDISRWTGKKKGD